VLTRKQRGVTLIELMIGLVIIGFLLMMGVPAFTTFLQNQKIRAAAESVLNGLQLARTEALTRNGQVELVLTNDEPTASTVNTLTASTAGRYWMVRYYNPTTLFYEFIQGKAAGEGGGEASGVVVTSTASTIAFTGLGTTTLGATATIAFTNPTGGTCAGSGGPMRCMNLTISASGQTRMCDPAVTATGDTRKC
jgi:type IV fimbrial biogenesis protein FimT